MAIVAMLSIWVLCGLIIALGDIFISRTRGALHILGIIISDILLVNFAALFVLRFVFSRDYIVDPGAYITPYWWKYVILAILIGLLFLTIKAAMVGFIRLEPDHAHLSPWRIVVMVVAVIAAAIGAFAGIGSWWFQDFYGVMTPEQFLFNFASPVGGANEDSMRDLYSRPVFLLFLVIFILTYLLVVPAKLGFGFEKKVWITRKIRQMIVIPLSFAICIGGCLYAYKHLHAKEIAQSYMVKSEYVQDNYVDPTSVKLTFPKHKRNLVHIYFESAETSYLDKQNGGYMDENLMPNLMELANTGVHFSHTDKPFGGPHQIYGTSWSVAGMTNMNFGIPLKAPGTQNSYGLDGRFLPGATGYTDILAKEGYNQTIMFGADAHFGGLDAFYQNHGVQTIFDVKYAREHGLIPQDYNVWWGFEDNKLYDYAKQEMTRLASEGKPFNLMMENADTHFPDGFVEPETQDKFGKQYANVIFNSQKQIVDLIQWIQAQPFGPDTTIVVTGDHLSMDVNFFKDWDPKYERTTFNAFINADFPERHFKLRDRQYASWDYFPTILSSLGVKIQGNRLALGTNLASNKQTLIERDGKDTVDKETSLYSQFYVDKLLNNKQS
ncbi:LTA synthase family protein [Galliscardovia ingluviei]|uniref:LTA synthase family protein n=1 Tax=Galliscardovia ingluviei TaxID=1769422 RepID=UPI0016648B10|nr:LTA synthase family protein [Galliscardovia ingluviei]